MCVIVEFVHHMCLFICMRVCMWVGWWVGPYAELLHPLPP